MTTWECQPYLFPHSVWEGGALDGFHVEETDSFLLSNGGILWVDGLFNPMSVILIFEKRFDKLTWLLARGQEERLHSPVRLYSLRQNFCVLVCDLNWQKLLLMMDQMTSSCCILKTQRQKKLRPQKITEIKFWHFSCFPRCFRVDVWMFCNWFHRRELTNLLKRKTSTGPTEYDQWLQRTTFPLGLWAGSRLVYSRHTYLIFSTSELKHCIKFEY